LQEKEKKMASVVQIAEWRAQKPPPWWVDHDTTSDSAPVPTGWLRSLAAVAEAVFADDAGAPDRDRIHWVVDQTRQYAEDVGGKATVVFRLGLFATNWLAPLFVAKLPPMKRLDIGDRVRALESYEASPLGLSLFAVKLFLSISWFEHPDVAEEVGFDGMCKGVAS
jgi:hypothetical protein